MSAPFPVPNDYPPLVQLRDDLEALDQAIGSGVLEIDSHVQGRIKYRDMRSMLTARSFLVRKINAMTGVVQTRRLVLTGRSGF